MNDDVVANEPDIGAALDDTLGDAAAGDIANLRNLEDFENEALPSIVSRSVGASNPDIAFFTSSIRL